MQKICAAMLCALCAGGAAAQDTPRATPADATKPGGVPAYESAFRDYRPYVDPELVRWRETNDEMARLKGHVGHLPASVRPGSTPTTARPPAHPGHGGAK
ncbi:MAG: hypothetical protein AB7O31_09255 [Burkholderiales bacterium]